MSAFDERKAAQVAAFFLQRAGGRMPHLKLVKLAYLSDREAMRRFGEPITWDKFVSMPHGPVPSCTLDLISGACEGNPDGWSAWVSDLANYEVALSRDANREALDHLSDADLEVLEAVWQGFGHMGKFEIRDWTHNNCSEWRDPKGSSVPIHYRDVFLALGRSREEAKELSSRMTQSLWINDAFARA